MELSIAITISIFDFSKFSNEIETKLVRLHFCSLNQNLKVVI